MPTFGQHAILPVVILNSQVHLNQSKIFSFEFTLFHVGICTCSAENPSTIYEVLNFPRTLICCLTLWGANAGMSASSLPEGGKKRRDQLAEKAQGNFDWLFKRWWIGFHHTQKICSVEKATSAFWIQAGKIYREVLSLETLWKSLRVRKVRKGTVCGVKCFPEINNTQVQHNLKEW